MDNDFRFVLHETPLDTYLQKAGPHKYISKKMVRGKWVYEYKDDVVKRVVDLLLDFLSNPARTATLGQVARSFRVNNVMAKEVVDSLVAQKRIELVPGERGVPTYRQATPKEAKPKPVVREPVISAGKVDPSLWEVSPKFGLAGGPDEYFLTEKGLDLAAKVATGLTRPGVEALRDLFALGTIAKIEQHYGAEVRQTPFGEKHGSVLSLLSASGYVKMHTGRDMKYSLTEKGNSALIAITKEEQALLKRIKETATVEKVEPPKVLIEPPKKTKKELQAQKKELQREANKIHGAGGQLSLDFTVKLELIDDKISDADINENAEKLINTIQDPKVGGKPKEPKVIEVDNRPDEDFTTEFGEHVWGSRADVWAYADEQTLKAMPVKERKKRLTKAKLMQPTPVERLLDTGASPECVLLRRAIESCIQAKAGESELSQEWYKQGIDFVTKNLNTCKTKKDILDFVSDWKQGLEGRRKLKEFTQQEMDIIKFDHLKKIGKEPKISATELRQFEDGKFDLTLEVYRLESDARKVSGKWDVFKITDGDSPEAVKARDAFYVKAKQLADIETLWEATGGEVWRRLSPREALESFTGIGGLDYNQEDGRYVVYEPDSNILGVIETSRKVGYNVREINNPWIKMATGLGMKFVKVVAVSNPQFHGPKAYRDAYYTTEEWKREKYSEEDREQKMYEYLDASKTGRGRRFKWERTILGEIDRKGGKPVEEAPTVEEFGKTFGLHNVQFGNWVKGDVDAAKSHLKGAQGALFDLADLLGVTPKTVSLNGRLSIGFGSRGEGGMDSAQAHFEPERQIINMTKKGGGGSLAHEWGHALDSIMCKAHNSEYGGFSDPTISCGYNEGLPKKVKEAFQEVVHAIRYKAVSEKDKKLLADGMAVERKVMNNRKCTKEEKVLLKKYHAKRDTIGESEWYQDAMALGEYYTSGKEMFARAFECYIEDTLKMQDRRSSYLVTGTDQYIPTQAFYEKKPGDPSTVKEAQFYPLGETRKKINEAMAELVKALAEEKALEKSLRLLDEQFFIKAG